MRTIIQLLVLIVGVAVMWTHAGATTATTVTDTPTKRTPGKHPSTTGTPGKHPSTTGTPGKHPSTTGTPGKHPSTTGTPGKHPSTTGTPGSTTHYNGTASAVTSSTIGIVLSVGGVAVIRQVL